MIRLITLIWMLPALAWAQDQNGAPPQKPAAPSMGFPYSPQALAVCAEGVTTVQFTVATDGKNISISRSSGIPVLDEDSIKAIAGTRWKAAMRNGQPIETPKTWRIKWDPTGVDGKKCVPAQPPASAP